jgi:hypothetical protein
MMNAPQKPDGWAPVPTVFSFRAQWLPLVMPFMAQQDIRYYLNGVCVRPWGKGVLLCATNGHALAMAYDEKGHAEREVIFQVDPHMVPAIRMGGTRRHRFKGLEMWVVAERVAGALTPALRVLLNCGQEYVPGASDAYVQAGNSEVDGKYPDYARVIPKASELKPGHAGTFATEYMRLLPQRNFDPFIRGRRTATTVRFHGIESSGAVICEVPEIPEFMAVVMPLRHDRSWGQPLPQWWTENLALLPAATETKQVTA